MAWLVVGDRVLASLEIAETGRERRRGLLGRDSMEGALLLEPARWVHTLGMRFTIDVAYCDAEMRVLQVTRMHPHRIGRPVWRARSVLEATAGDFGRWCVEPGAQMEIRR